MVEYYSAVKRNGLLIHTSIDETQNTVLRRRSQPREATCCIVPFM